MQHVRIRDKYVLKKCGNYDVLLEPSPENLDEVHERRVSGKINMKDTTIVHWICLALSANSSDDQSSANMEDSLGSEGSMIEDDDDQKLTEDLKTPEDELRDYIKPSFWLFIEQKKKTSTTQVDVLEVKFFLYCG